MRLPKDIFNLKNDGGLSSSATALSLSLFKGVVDEYLGVAGATGLDWRAIAEMDVAAPERRLLGRGAADDHKAPNGKKPARCGPSRYLFLFKSFGCGGTQFLKETHRTWCGAKAYLTGNDDGNGNRVRAVP